MAENKMFCFQCQETAKGTGCTIKGVCGKEATTSKWQDPHPWRVKPSLIAAIKVAFRQKGYKQKEAAKAIGVSTTALSDILHGRRAINFDVARNIYHNLGVPANVVLG